ncbi:MAG: EAL domain-containing protein [Planctomycetaceae bacterium]|nr:EAL domain-containing protein [Planctomycetaceae bacterium]
MSAKGTEFAVARPAGPESDTLGAADGTIGMLTWMLVGNIGSTGEIRSKLLDPLPFRVGRRPEASLALHRPAVSGLHAELFTVEDRLFVRDLGSTNGTFINGERIQDSGELTDGDTVQFADIPFRIAREARRSDSRTVSQDFYDHALARVQIEKLLNGDHAIPYFQPIVDLQTDEVIAYEVLARSRLVGLESPGRMFAAAADLNQEAQLSKILRTKGVQVSQELSEPPHVFLNTHPAEFLGAPAWDWLKELREQAPLQPLTIEVHEAAITDVAGIARFRAMLREYDIGLAFDDFGAGQARIAELAEVRPDYLKFDRRIITALDQADVSRRRFVRCLIDAIHDIGVVPLAEGIETPGEHAACRDLGFELAQGYLLGVPSSVETCQNLMQTAVS